MADKTEQEKYIEEARNYNAPVKTVLSGISDTIKGTDFEEGIGERTGESINKLRERQYEAFNPIIYKKFYPGYKEDQAEAKKLYEVYKNNKKAYKDKEKAIDKEYRELEKDLKQKYATGEESLENKTRDLFEKSTKRRQETADRKAEEKALKASERIDKRNERLMNKYGKYQDKSINANNEYEETFYGKLADIVGDKITSIEDQPVEAKKKTVRDSNILNLSPEERKEYEKIEKELAKQKLDELKTLADDEQAAISKLKNSDDYTAMKKASEEAKEQWRKAKQEIRKKNAPYAIRNTFLIIDAIQKSLRNIGRALPQVQNSPTYTKTAMEEPELFRLWAQQIDKGLEREMKQEDTMADVIAKNTGTAYSTPENLPSKLTDRSLSWEDKIKEFKLTQQEKLVAEETYKNLAKYKSDFTDEELQDLALAATIDKVRSGDESYSSAQRDMYVVKNFETVDQLRRWLKVGGVAIEMVKGTLGGIKDNVVANVFSGGTSSSAAKAIIGALDALPKLGEMTDDQINNLARDLIYDVEDLKALWGWIKKLVTAKKDKNAAVKIEKIEKKLNDLVEARVGKDGSSGIQKEYEDALERYEGNKANPNVKAIQARLDKNQNEIDKLEKELEKYYPIDQMISDMTSRLDKKMSDIKSEDNNKSKPEEKTK